MNIVSYRVGICDSTLDSRWREYICAHPDSTVFHHPGWLGALEAENGRPVMRLACFDGPDRIVGVLPLVVTRGMPLGIGNVIAARRVSSLPRTPLAGPLADSPDITRMLCETAFKIVKSERAVRFQCKSTDDTLAAQCPELHRVSWRISCIKRFPAPSEKLLFGNKRNNMRIITSAHKSSASGLSVGELTDRERLSEWYLLYAKTMRRHLVPARSFSFFRALWDNMYDAGHLKMVVATHCDYGMVAGSLFLLFKDGCYYAFNGSDPASYSMRPNDSIQYWFQNYAHSHGYRYLDLGEISNSPEGAGLLAFKRKWGVEERQIYHYYSPAIQGEPDTSKSSLLCHILQPVWRRLPVSVTIVAGRIANRFL